VDEMADKYVYVKVSDLEKLKREHLQCEDPWYSCPKSGQCFNDNAGDCCTCGADDINEAIDKMIGNTV